MKKTLLSIALAAILLTGCATAYDKGMNEDYQTTAQNHATNQTLQVNSKSEDIASLTKAVLCSDDTAACGMSNALMVTLAAREISSIEAQKFTQRGPTLNNDVLLEGTKYVKDLIFGLTTIKIVETVAENGGQEFNTNGGSVIESGNRKEVHATAIDSEGAVQSSSADEDQSVTN
jgi:predicted small secreted protein